ncbi:cytosol aminopeptidase-like [Coccinella septempunctata]|uniref:cytosol aminopeptidase-like n=1 Tax=Coccinella septempunctata TaxID=41139 RepID=UPI001D071128|nr:cytosol aminopeptidase-like [Coccinella septempunctata]
MRNLLNCIKLEKFSRYIRLSQGNRFYSSQKVNKNGIVLGVYSEKIGDETKLILTPAAEKFNELSHGKFLSNLKFVESEIKEGKSFVFWGLHEDYQAVAVTGLGEKNKKLDSLELIDSNKEGIRLAAANGCTALKNAGVKNISVESLGDAEASAEGSVLGTWKFQEYKTKKDDIPKVNLVLEDESEYEKWNRGVIKADAQNLARKLADTPSNLLTPTIFSQQIVEVLRSENITIEVHDQEWARKENMNAFLSVAKGSIEPPKFLELTYNNGKNDKPYVLVGKGVTFDAGGISIKPSTSMDHMRADMGGAASVTATLYAVDKLKIPVNLKVLIPLVENMPSGSALKPGDVIKARNGKTICVDNTDAEGRLILADALCYSSKFTPKWVLDIATLTGAMMVALGSGATGVFTNSDHLFSILQSVSSITGDRVWRFPLWKHYLDQIAKNDAYDLNNIGQGRGGGSCTAAAFLKEFVPENTEWLHLDMAGVMGPQPDTSMPYLGKGMTGRPTRTLIEFIAAQK